MLKNSMKREETLLTIIYQLLYLIAGMLVLIGGLVMALFHYSPTPTTSPKVVSITPDKYGNFTKEAQLAALAHEKDTIDYWTAPDVAELKSSEQDLVLYGKDIIAHTSAYYGPEGNIFKSATNGMNCQNCHLEAGTKVFGNNYSAVASTYPKYRSRSGSIENIYKRVNDCFERSLNGKSIDTTSREMQAIVAYIKWLGKDVPKGKKPEGSGLKDLSLLNRPSDPGKGKEVYVQKCQSCHQADGEGLMNSMKTAYTYPPLWGDHSYNNGAGLYRISFFAKFAKSNMPLGASFDNPQLTDEEAWDVAAFVNSQSRPKKELQYDWPKIQEKPFDHPFGPYADGFDEKQHKYGPFKPIQEKIAEIKKKQKV